VPSAQPLPLRNPKLSLVITMNNDRPVSRARIEITPDKRFLRFHKPFHDAVRTGQVSAIANVLLRADLSGDQARRTAKKILAEQR
jgi:D-ribose pyranose/furanose isomerase RbsD